ncbi:hypothetical protein W02_18490 [Nitrospira sp. KM1]|nr:hypothetical protein W02_18490 [Nitrospira sp. KM1]
MVKVVDDTTEIFRKGATIGPKRKINHLLEYGLEIDRPGEHTVDRLDIVVTELKPLNTENFLWIQNNGRIPARMFHLFSLPNRSGILIASDERPGSAESS